MRVIAGSARGRALRGPAETRRGEQPALRPTSDMIRGVIFGMLDAMGADYSRVLDLYAGTGALGIEALSRGDGEADFIELDGAALDVIKANLASTGFEGRARVHKAAADRTIGRLTGPYTLILADPPYGDETALETIERIAASALADAETILVVEHHRRVAPPETIGGMRLYRTRRHGDTVVSIYDGKETQA